MLIMTRLFFNSLADANALKSLKMLSIPFLRDAQFNIMAGRKPAAILSILLIRVSWFIFAGKGIRISGLISRVEPSLAIRLSRSKILKQFDPS